MVARVVVVVVARVVRPSSLAKIRVVGSLPKWFFLVLLESCLPGSLQTRKLRVGGVIATPSSSLLGLAARAPPASARAAGVRPSPVVWWRSGAWWLVGGGGNGAGWRRATQLARRTCDAGTTMYTIATPSLSTSYARIEYSSFHLRESYL